MPKNPFEIRSDVLKLATEQMEQSYQNNLEHVKTLQKLGESNMEQLSQAMKPYSFDELMKRAQEMYNFVQKK